MTRESTNHRRHPVNKRSEHSQHINKYLGVHFPQNRNFSTHKITSQTTPTKLCVSYEKTQLHTVHQTLNFQYTCTANIGALHYSNKFEQVSPRAARFNTLSYTYILGRTLKTKPTCICSVQGDKYKLKVVYKHPKQRRTQWQTPIFTGSICM